MLVDGQQRLVLVLPPLLRRGGLGRSEVHSATSLGSPHQARETQRDDYTDRRPAAPNTTTPYFSRGFAISARARAPDPTTASALISIGALPA